MVFVKVRETYDLATVQNKMTVIGIHTPHPDIIKRNYPGLLMQCKAYRPVSADVRVACASMEALDPLQVGTGTGSIAPEDAFNPILYKAMSNFGMSQLEARINAMKTSQLVDVHGECADVDVDSVTHYADEFNIYYGLLSNTHEWKHASPQAGLSMSGLRPLVWEALYNVGDHKGQAATMPGDYAAPDGDGNATDYHAYAIRGNSKPIPFMNCTYFTYVESSKEDPKEDPKGVSGQAQAGFTYPPTIPNASQGVPWINCYVAALVLPPSKLHTLFYRMIVEWTLEFSSIRSIQEISNWWGIEMVGTYQHYQNYDYSTTKELVTGQDVSVMDSDTCMVSANVDVKKVM